MTLFKSILIYNKLVIKRKIEVQHTGYDNLQHQKCEYCCHTKEKDTGKNRFRWKGEKGQMNRRGHRHEGKEDR